MSRFRVTRRVEIPDRFRIERALRLPELGPRILFFSGGSALRKAARQLKRYTHNSTHVITAFDSGGSSAQLRQVFGMPSIGDLRNRLLALANETVQGNPEIYRLFSHRLPFDEPPDRLRARLAALVDGSDPLVSDLPESMGRLIRTHLRAIAERIEETRFDLRGASIGNLVLASGYLENDRHVDSVLFLFSKLVGVLGQVVPVTEEDLHLAYELEDGTELLGQHRIGGRDGSRLTAPVRTVRLVRSLTSPEPASVRVSGKIAGSIEGADLICYPMGSFYSSLIANLLPEGVAEAIARAECPRVYVPNLGRDPEQEGRSVADCVEILLRELRRSDPSRPTDHLLNFVLLDRSEEPYGGRTERERLRGLGVTTIEMDLWDGESPPRVHPERLVEALVSLA